MGACGSLKPKTSDRNQPSFLRHCTETSIRCASSCSSSRKRSGERPFLRTSRGGVRTAPMWTHWRRGHPSRTVFPMLASLHEARRRRIWRRCAQCSRAARFSSSHSASPEIIAIPCGTVPFIHWRRRGGVTSNPEDFGFRNLRYEEVLGDLAQVCRAPESNQSRARAYS